MDLSAASPNDLFEEEAEMKGISTASAATIVHTNANGQIVHQGELMAAPFKQERGNRLQPLFHVECSCEARWRGIKLASVLLLLRSVISMHRKELLFGALTKRKLFLRELRGEKTKQKKKERLGVCEHQSGALVNTFYGYNCKDEREHDLLSCQEA